MSTRQQRRVPPGRRGVHRDGLLCAEAIQVMRAARFGAGAAQAFASERLHADHRANLVAVDVDISYVAARASACARESMRVWMPIVRP